MYWTRDEVILPGHITVDNRADIILEFWEMNPDGTVVICGGESMMNPERFWPITTKCKELGLKCFAVTNGTMITDSATAERLILEGPTEITISLNSHIPYIHDLTRGVIGSWDMATNAVKLLLEARERLNIKKPIYTMAIVCEQNYMELDPFYDFVLNDLKADKLKLNFLQPTFGSLKDSAGFDRNDKFYEKNVIEDYDKLVEVIRHCDKKYNLNLNSEWIDVVKLYHKSVNDNDDATKGWQGKGTEKVICNSYYRNIMIDMYGVARFCFSTGFPGTKINNFGDLRQFWYNNDELRLRMSTCTQYCGISHSVRKISATKR